MVIITENQVDYIRLLVDTKPEKNKMGLMVVYQIPIKKLEN
jgi:hypothetical protein